MTWYYMSINKFIMIWIVTEGCFLTKWIFLPEETIIPENWKPVFRMPETSLILLKWFMLVSMRFVKPSPRKRCEAGLINLIGTSRIFKAEISNSTSGFLWPDRQCNAIQIIQPRRLYHLILILDLSRVWSFILYKILGI